MMLKKFYDWMNKQVHQPWATPLLAFLFFIEAIFFVPVDPLLILFCIEKRNKSFYFATVATISSVLGGIAGYLIGFGIWEGIGQTLVNAIISESLFNKIVSYFTLYQSWVVLIAGFTPLPYKGITLAAGFCKLSIIPFIINSFLSRGARFFLIAGIIYRWGKQMKKYIDQYFNRLVILFVIIVITIIWFLSLLH